MFLLLYSCRATWAFMSHPCCGIVVHMCQEKQVRWQEIIQYIKFNTSWQPCWTMACILNTKNATLVYNSRTIWSCYFYKVSIVSNVYFISRSMQQMECRTEENVVESYVNQELPLADVPRYVTTPIDEYMAPALQVSIQQQAFPPIPIEEDCCEHENL